MELGTIEKDLSDVEKQIETTVVDGKFEGTVVLTPGCLGSFIASVLMDFAGEGGLLSGTSPWKDKLGEKVADERITVSLSPLDERIVCGDRITGEGFRAEDFDIIKDGSLNAFAIGLYASNKLKLPRGLNDSFCLVMPSGSEPLEKIISSIDKGIVVGRFSG